MIKINTVIKLTKNEEHILKKIENDPLEFLDNHITNYAKLIYTSASALSRLSTKLKFGSYQMFKIYVAKIVYKNNNHEDKNKNILITDGIIDKYIEAININKDINYGAINKLSDDLIYSDKALVFGMGTSKLAVDHLSHNLIKFSINVIPSNDIHKTIQYIENILTKKSIVIIISKEFISKEVRYILKICKSKKIPIWTITSNKNITKYNLKNNIFFNHLEQKNRMFSFSSKIISLLIIDILLAKMMSKVPNLNNNDMFISWKEKE